MKTVQIARYGMLLALALVFSYLEACVPVVIAVPGVKIGLANMITIFFLYKTNFKKTFFFMCIRVLLAGILFSGISGIIYSFAGGLFCIGIMSVLKRFSCFSVLGVSMAGALFHNLGQILVAVVAMENVRILYYLLVLCVSGAISGLLVGYLSFTILKRLQNVNFEDE